MKLREITESFQHYTVKHKSSGTTYEVTAMHEKSAIDKAKAQHGGTASRYTGTSSDDFEIVEGIDSINEAVYSVIVNGQEQRYREFRDADVRIWKHIRGLEQKTGLPGLSKSPQGKVHPSKIILKRDNVQVPHRYTGKEEQPITGPWMRPSRPMDLNNPEFYESLTEEQFDEAAGEKDACYHKVKSRYDVWPSAYASGALTKCRKVGAKNWGNSKKK
tara:strand:- start:27789 stop:28439 length:651 start_codon:yes stop_codon:yes gene_type:complete